MFFRRIFKRRERAKTNNGTPPQPSVQQGIYYLYLIVGVQVLFVFGLVTVLMFVGKILATPGWVFLAAFLAGVAGCVYIYRKAKLQLQKLRDTIKRVDLSDRNYEISFMGGALTMRVEQNPNRMIEAAPRRGDQQLLESETIDTPVR